MRIYAYRSGRIAFARSFRKFRVSPKAHRYASQWIARRIRMVQALMRRVALFQNVSGLSKDGQRRHPLMSMRNGDRGHTCGQRLIPSFA